MYGVDAIFMKKNKKKIKKQQKNIERIGKKEIMGHSKQK